MSGLLVSAAELAAHPQWRVFDCRHDLKNPLYGRQAYGRGHIPGALFLHLDEDLSGTKNGSNGRHPLPDAEVLVEKLRACGVDNTTQVVAYDNEGSIFAARLWWLLRWLGHQNVAVLDGGLPGWKRSGGALEETIPTFARSTFAARPGVAQADAASVLALVNQNALASSAMIIDARSPERFQGQNETLDPVGGHIPGAVNRFYFENLDDAGCFFKPVDELKAEFAELLGGRAPAQVIQQCGSGVTACHNLLAMELAGLSGSRLYPGSWSEWCSDSSRPVATGPVSGE